MYTPTHIIIIRWNCYSVWKLKSHPDIYNRDGANTVLQILFAEFSFQISQSDIMGTAIDQLTIPDCQFTIKWVGDEGNSDLIPFDLHHDVQFTGSHQKKAESYFHLHFRCPQGEYSFTYNLNI